MAKTAAPAEQPEIVEEPIQEQPEAQQPEQQPEGEAPAEQPEAVAQPEVAEELAPEADENALAEINSAVRPMKPADGSDGSCDRYKSDKGGNILVPASEVPAMLEHGFVLVEKA